MINIKLYPPRLGPKLVTRANLLNRLAEWPDKKLTLVSAPPGSGKTTLVADWTQSLSVDVKWASLDPAEDDPVRFWSLLLACLKADLSEPERLDLLLHAPAPMLDALVTELLNQLAERSGPLILVLDDYHVLVTPALHEAMALLVERLPPQVHLVLISRADPLLPLARFRAKGWLNEIRASDLRFSPPEAAEYLNTRMALALSAGELDTLLQATEGWVSGLQLAALSLERTSDRVAFLATFAGTHRFVLDYLIEEALRTQPEPVQRFLLETSLLDRFSAPLCDALCERSDSQEMLEALEKANLFLVPLDDDRCWYRYHRLFADMLRHQLVKARPTAVEVLHLRASAWFELEGRMDEAIQHALAGKHHDRAASLMASTPAILRRGEVATMNGWLAELPDEHLDRWPLLLLYRGWMLFPTGQRPALEAILARVDKALEANPAIRATLEAPLLALQSLTARMQGDIQRTIALSEAALSRLPEDDWMWRTRVALNLAALYQFSDRTGPAMDSFDLILSSCRASSDPFHEMLALALKGNYCRELGRWSEAQALYTQALERAHSVGAHASAFASFALVGQGPLLAQQGQEEEAIQSLKEGLACAEGSIEPIVHATRWLGHLFQKRGEHQAADRIWQEGITVALDRRLVSFERYVKAQRAIERQVPDEALELWVDFCQTVSEVQPPHWPVEDRDLVWAESLRLLGRIEEANECLAKVEARSWAVGRHPLARRAAALRTPDHAASPPVAARSMLSPITGLLEPLSDREREVLVLMSEGMTNQDIAARLCIEVSTVKRHGTNLFGKLGASNRTQAVARARALGLL